MKPLAALLALALLHGGAQAQTLCMPYQAFVKALKDRYGETSQGKGVAGDVMVIELFTSPETFTVRATTTDGRSCIVAAGKGWSVSPPETSGENL